MCTRARTGLQCLQLCADALVSCDLSPLSALTDLRALALTSHNDKQRYAVPPAVLGARRRPCSRPAVRVSHELALFECKQVPTRATALLHLLRC